MKKRRMDRKVRQEKHRAKRRYDFTAQTQLQDFIDIRSYKALVKLLEQLQPYLIDNNVTWNNATRLYFDLDKIEGIRKFVITKLAEFLHKVDSAGRLKKPKAMFFRYLSSPDHCNLEIAEPSLKALILKAIREKN